jgi:transcriptional regulator with XRE-family HTH domain
MKETMGQIIRTLRKERGMTQEDLAEKLGITYQAVSKWENGTGMPDISQVVPIARLFGVSTDVLFGLFGASDTSEVAKIIDKAQSALTRPLSAKGLTEKYRILQEGLRLYPNSIALLSECLETGLPLAYPETGEYYDPTAGEEIYRACIRYADTVISYSKNVSDVMRAHMIMVMLHSAYGNFAAARPHIKAFPYRADFNLHVMHAYYAHWKKDYALEAGSCQYGVMHYLEGILNVLTKLGQAYTSLGSYADAAETLQTALAMIDCVFANDDLRPPIHYREQGDLYKLLADNALRAGDKEGALGYLTKMVEYDREIYPRIDGKTRTRSPLLRARPHEFYIKRIDRYRSLLSKLTDPCFDSLRDVPEYQRLIALAREA